MGQNKRKKIIWIITYFKISKLQNMDRKQIKQASCNLQFCFSTGPQNNKHIVPFNIFVNNKHADM